MNLIIGGWGGIGVVQLKSVLAYSSIGHLGFVIILRVSRLVLGLYYMVYSVSLRALIMVFYLGGGRSISKIKSRFVLKMVLVIRILSLAGIPPTTGFILK